MHVMSVAVQERRKQWSVKPSKRKVDLWHLPLVPSMTDLRRSISALANAAGC
jgi:hypothetical protein